MCLLGCLAFEHDEDGEDVLVSVVFEGRLMAQGMNGEVLSGRAGGVAGAHQYCGARNRWVGIQRMHKCLLVSRLAEGPG